MISTKQKQLLHVAARSLGLDRDQYEAVLLAQAGVRSSNDLTNAGFDAVVRRFEELGFKNTARRSQRTRRYKPAGPKQPVTPDQQGLLDDLYARLGWADMPRRMGFSKRQCGKSWPQTRTDAQKVIEGLKSMLARREAK